jgi:effector-binding domain-containing protein
MFTKIFYAVVIALLVFIFIGFLLPREVHVERSIVIQQPVDTVFSLVNGFESFEAWSPWADDDPDAVYAYSGPETGVGARMSWTGDPRQVGKGWQEITDVKPGSLVRMHLNFEQQGEADTYFMTERTQGGTLLTWGFDADLVEGQGLFGGILARYFGLFFDKWVGADYEKGLLRLKAHAESLPQDDFRYPQIEVLDLEPADILFVQTDPGMDSADMAASLADAYREITRVMQEQQIEMVAQPMAISRAWDEQGFRFEAAIPVNLVGFEASGRVQAGQSPSGRAVRIVHRGPYDAMGPAYEKLAAYMEAHGLREGRVSWEQYISDPGITPAEELVTHIYFMIAEQP